MKNMSESPLMPIVPGPVISAKTFTREKAPLTIPNPNPATELTEKHRKNKSLKCDNITYHVMGL